MTIRRKCTPRADHTAIYSEAIGTIYPQGTDGPMAADAVVLAKLREPVIQQVLSNLGGVLNTGELFDDAAPGANPAILAPYGQEPADATDGRRVMLDKAGVALTVEGPCQMTVTGPDGIKVWIGRGAAPGDYQDGSASSGTAIVHVPAGPWWISAKLDPAMKEDSITANLWRGKA